MSRRTTRSENVKVIIRQSGFAMANAYVVGQLTVKDPELWKEYRNRVLATLIPWEGELVFRGKQVSVLSGTSHHHDIVVIRFPNLAKANGWFSSFDYQGLIPLWQHAADMTLSIYEE
ncbi:DUF1330 domain-containing protein [Laribacter hongkongensis]|uniref:DUF1330 domain-containing protein n=1 Tax=Laribacter hongkongensis TaxID=168471 RepID=UPI001EFEC9AE|nr:DUF1330 domain-containing protein [Laribacter hongkongensis]MCG9075854.1 DUF1330 domain-containing protein [Laribacter hongkongensis]